MSKNYQFFMGHLELAPRLLMAEMDFSSGGTLSINQPGSLGFVSVERISIGNYHVTIDEKFNRILGLQGSFLYDGDSNAVRLELKTDELSTIKRFKMVVRGQNGSGVDPEAGTRLLLHLWVSDAKRYGS